MKSLPIFLMLVMIFSCQTGDDYTGVYTVKGTIKYDNGQIAGTSQIYLNNELKTTTNGDGDFRLNNIDAGKYKLKATHSDNSGYAETEVEIELRDSDLDLESLLLPVPVRLLDPSGVTSTSLTLTWNRCEASDFREYKIYIHNSGALDESTGTLLHVATHANDTVLTVNAGDFWWAGSTLTPNTTYYFRVFVMNSYGRLSGSNIMAATTSLWDDADKFTSNYTIALQSSFAAQGNLTGIAWDGAYFWMLYFEELGGFYDPNRITLVKFDYLLGRSLDTMIFDDSNYFPAGIAWDGENVWISFGTYIQSVDPDHETLGKKYYAGESTVDLAWNGENLILLDIWNKVIILNPLNGSISNQFMTPFQVIGYSGEKGVAARENEIWIINNWHHEIAIMNNAGKHIGVAEVDFLQQGFTGNNHRIPMCFMENNLVIALDSQVKIYSIERRD